MNILLQYIEQERAIRNFLIPMIEGDYISLSKANNKIINCDAQNKAMSFIQAHICENEYEKNHWIENQGFYSKNVGLWNQYEINKDENQSLFIDRIITLYKAV